MVAKNNSGAHHKKGLKIPYTIHDTIVMTLIFPN